MPGEPGNARGASAAGLVWKLLLIDLPASPAASDHSLVIRFRLQADALLGGAVAYRDGDPAELESIEPGAPLQWVVAWTGEKVSTGGLIRDVRSRHPVGAPIYQAIGDFAEEGIRLLEAGDARGLGAALNAGHAQLESLGVVPDEPAAIVRALQADPDVLGARMWGAGGGDCLLILAEDPEFAAAAARQHGLEVLDIAPDEAGLVLEDSK